MSTSSSSGYQFAPSRKRDYYVVSEGGSASSSPNSDTEDSYWGSPSSDEEDGACCAAAFCGRQPQRATKRANNPTEGERQVVQDLNALSLQEREKVYEEIHGIPALHEFETQPGKLDTLLEEMKEKLKSIRRNKKVNSTAYELALYIAPKYVDGRDFKLMFLRSELYDTEAACKCMLSYFQWKLDLFGISKIGKRISWNDLTPEDQQEVLHCSSQAFPDFRDSSGRTCFLWDARTAFKYMNTLENNLRMTWYNLEGLAHRDVKVQQQGLVGISYQVDVDMAGFTAEFSIKYCSLVNILPFRYAALHFTYNDARFKPLISVIQTVLQKNTRIRFRAHYGSHMEVHYSLMQYGFRKNMIPMNDSGELVPDRFLEYLQERQTEENQQDDLYNQDASKIYFPQTNDVLGGKGNAVTSFPGNLLMNSYVQMYVNQYQAAPREEKTLIAGIIVENIKAKGGRFLRRDKKEDYWMEQDDMAARDKVSNAFRAILRF